MVDELCSGPCMALEIHATDAPKVFRDFCGPADPVSVKMCSIPYHVLVCLSFPSNVLIPTSLALIISVFCLYTVRSEHTSLTSLQGHIKVL